MDNDNASFGYWLRRRRKALDLTQAELAQQVGCSAALIRAIEADTRRPSRQIAELLADQLAIPTTARPAFLQVARHERSVNWLTRHTELADPSSLDLTDAAASIRITSVPNSLAIQPTSLMGGETEVAKVQQLSTEDVSVRQPGRGLGVLAGNLPAQATPFIGRRAALEEIAELLHNPACRLLTLLGSGGIGKTRLAIQAASQVLFETNAAFRHGVAFVPLVALSGAELLVPALANAIRLNFHGAPDPQEQLLASLHDKQLLLVLDNFEYLLTASSPLAGTLQESLSGPELLAEILRRAPGVKFMVTSRERLNLQGEWLLEVQGLDVPQGARPEGVQKYTAIQLFLESARRVRVGFKVSGTEEAAMVRVCQMLEGMPLGIELAAAWVRTLS